MSSMTDGELKQAREGWQRLSEADVELLHLKEKDYRGSWRKRGGIGAYMMLARKFDRLEEAAQRCNYDIFEAIDCDRRPDGILDDIRDLRCYLLLVEEHVTQHGNEVVETQYGPVMVEARRK